MFEKLKDSVLMVGLWPAQEALQQFDHDVDFAGLPAEVGWDIELRTTSEQQPDANF